MQVQARKINAYQFGDHSDITEKNCVELYPYTKQVYNGTMKKSQDKILTLLQINPERGLALMIEKYSGYVYTIVKNKLLHYSKQDIEECTSDVFYSIYQSRDRIDETKGSLKAFVCTVAKRKAIDYLRKTSSEKFDALDDTHSNIPSSDNIPEIAFFNEQKEALLRAIRQLDDIDAQIVTRKYYFGQSNKEIAGALHMNENAISKRSVRAMRKLERILDREGFINE